jgi:hypothetical protein
LIAALVVLVNTSLTLAVPLLAAWLIPATNARVQLKVAPPVELVAV